MRDESYDISRAFDLLTSDAKLKLDYRIAKNSEEQAAQAQQMTSAQHRLNVLAAITFPIMAVATVLGMNLRHGFENQSPLYFMVVLVSGVVIGMFVKRWVAR
jgi:Mg2+ and Co2+ transporter CorA